MITKIAMIMIYECGGGGKRMYGRKCMIQYGDDDDDDDEDDFETVRL